MRVAWMAMVVGCGGNPAPAVSDAVIDTRLDAYEEPCTAGYGLTPVILNGTSPSGPLDVFRFARTMHSGGDCPDEYHIAVAPNDGWIGCGHEPWLQLSIPAPFDGANPHPAKVLYIGPSESFTDFTDQVAFDATELDDPTVAAPRVEGRFVSHDPAWTFDFAVDLVSLPDAPCI